MANRTTIPVVPGYDALELELVPIPDNSIDIGAVLQRTAEMLEHLATANGSRFPWGARSAIAYEKEMEGRAFVFVSPPVSAEVEDAFNKGQTKQIMRVLVRFYIPATGELMPPREARFQGGYTVSQLRALTERDIVGSYLWTLARDEDESPYQRGDGWEYPRKLAIWNPEVDAPVEDRYDMRWSESVVATAKKVAALAEQNTTILPTRSAKSDK